MATTLPALTETEITHKLATLGAGWHRDGKMIVKEYVLPGFTEATQFIAQLPGPANAMDHHPDVELTKYKRVKIRLWTHSRDGLTQNDFDLAGQIDALVS